MSSTEPTDSITNTTNATCTNFVVGVFLKYSVNNKGEAQEAEFYIYYKDTDTFSDSSIIASQLFGVVVRGSNDFTDGSSFDFNGWNGRYVGFTGGIGYRFGDYVQFGKATYDTSFQGVKTELPFSGIRMRDSTGNCITIDSDKSEEAVFSENFETLNLGVNKILSCKLEISSVSNLNTSCNTLAFQYLYNHLNALPIYGVANLDFSQDWVIYNDNDTPSYSEGTGKCTFKLPKISIIYQKFGY